MSGSHFQNRLEQEFRVRREKNPRYSLRAFAAFLKTDHSTLSQIFRGNRRVPSSQIRIWARRLGLTSEEICAYVAAEHVPDRDSGKRLEQLRHWTAEAISVVTGPAHWEILRLVRAPSFRTDCRWIARQIGVSVDEVNLVLSRLLRLGLLEINPAGEWRDATGLPRLTERTFKKLALGRVRQKAAEVHVQFGAVKRTDKKPVGADR